MARYGAEHKQATRRRMIETAGRRFKRNGIDGSGIATLVADAGLTNGAFYGHFSSKDDLVAAVVTDQLDAQVARLDALPAGSRVEAFIRDYLSAAHRDDPATGCPSAALLDEIGRCDSATRQAYTAGVRSVISAIARHLDDGDDHTSAAEERAIALVGLLVGSLQLARALEDGELSDRVLAAAHTNALQLARAGRRPTNGRESA
ncbi:TetR/AcrR family transcriptional regulator [Intrasporangium calvum]|uniref:Transcriptional regulator, TetR family n=1 Tax=Intrasporangium calvum (strain ATCC 23552 / DSM 43043 / JCM 3097 / NBRC 12989 / NCIMB 10167 / NRRL B-3866 / 7 KIP) TaxID=710696 RepID=E6SC50_INTC7|nr:TetR/AcrR family transcriptional regulator [Intrasporangium calvum]ADU47394.1 transcriptional regulator, TetR family [Intrasporangium calvum DSM 43043]